MPDEAAGTPLLRAKKHFVELADLSPDERRERVAQIESIDPDAANVLRKLLAAHDSAAGFFSSAAPTAEPSRQIGPYKLLQRIGEGAFGEVWMAEQSEPVRRRVAVKLLKAGLGARSIIARFEAERQALAIMDHPNIAKVFDAGTSPDGQPFFVMELISGLPITRYCDEAKLSLEERLRLFMPVCQAVHHAHQRGVIHRDLKPGNVLVTQIDGKPLPKVIDFGVAKALDRPLTDKTIFTEHRTMIGTPEYMSPEQAEISAIDVDTRSDVYSLGVLLYELLVGTTPFEATELRSKAFGELQRIIREVDPPRPSERISTLAQPALVGGARRTEIGRLGKLVRGELDWIVMKCLEKDRRRRYDSASELAKDLDNYLRGDAVNASPPSAVYRVRKFVRRHRAVVVGSVATLLGLTIGLVAALLALREAQAQRRLAEQNAAIASANAERASASATRATTVSGFLERIITFADPYQQADRDPRLSQVLRFATDQLKNGALSTQPEAEASLRTIVGRTLDNLHQYRAARETLLQAVEYRRKQQPRDERELARALMHLASTEANLGNYADSHKLYEEALPHAQSTGDEKLQGDLRFNIGTSLMAQLKYDEARPHVAQAVEAARRRANAEPLDLASAIESLADLETRSKRGDRAVQLLSEAIEIRRRYEPADALSIAEARVLLAQAYAELRKNDDAITVLEEALTAVKTRADQRSGTIAMIYDTLSRRYAFRRRFDRAAELAEQALAIREQLDGPGHQRTIRTRIFLGQYQYNLGKRDDARRNFEVAWATARDRSEIPMEIKAEAASQLAAIDVEKDEPVVKERFEYALSHYRGLAKPASNYDSVLNNYFTNRYLAGDWSKAIELGEERLRIAPQIYGELSREMVASRRLLARAMLRRSEGDWVRVEALCRAALDDCRKLDITDPVALASVEASLGDAIKRQGRVDDGNAILRKVIETLKSKPDATSAEKRSLAEAEEALAR